MKKVFLLFCLIQFQLSSSGQSAQEVLMRVFPNDAILKIDNQLIIIEDQPTPFKLKLKPGKYPLEIWASQYEVFRDTLVVKEKTMSYSKKLTERIPSYITYQKEKKANNEKKILRIGGTIALVALNVGGFYYSINSQSKIKDLEQEAERLQVLHQNLALPNSFELNRRNYDAVLEEYDQERKKIYLRRSIGIPLSCISTYFSQKIIRKLWSKKLSKPVLTEDKNPFVFNGLEINNLDASYQFTLNFKF